MSPILCFIDNIYLTRLICEWMSWPHCQFKELSSMKLRLINLIILTPKICLKSIYYYFVYNYVIPYKHCRVSYLIFFHKNLVVTITNIKKESYILVQAIESYAHTYIFVIYLYRFKQLYYEIIKCVILCRI